MSRLTELIAQAKVKDPQMGADLEREIKALSSRRAFGLNFERHKPEAVELPNRPVRKGDKVRLLPERSSKAKPEQELWQVIKVFKKEKPQIAEIRPLHQHDSPQQKVLLKDLVVVAEFRDFIYPGLISTGKVQRGGDKPYHSVINGENYHVLKALTYTHKGKFDAIYIDPPYNTGAKDWKYNNDYVEREDLYRHSKWLAFMERRIQLARTLLNSQDSVLMVTIDEKEVHRLRLLLEQSFPEAKVQMITTVISQNGTSREGEFSRVDEYILIARIGDSKISRTNDNMLANEGEGKVSRVWFNFMRTSTPKEKLEGQFYPIFINPKSGVIIELGEPVGKGNNIPIYKDKEDRVAVWPVKDDGSTATWGAVPTTAQGLLDDGYLRLGSKSKKTGMWSIQYVRLGDRKRVEKGEIKVTGRKPEDNSVILEHVDVSNRENFPKTVWNRKSHDATAHGTRLNKALLPGRNFPYPKSLYAVEDSLRFFIKSKPKALILDFFSGSGTTAHAVMRLNRQDGGIRQCISVTNNEVAADEQKSLRKQGLRPGDEEWEKWGICDYITKPRVKAAITGTTSNGEPIKGEYKFTDEFPMAEGFEENAEFFTLTYEAALTVSHNRAFKKIAPLLWLKAGGQGRRIDELPDEGWNVVDNYGLLVDLDNSRAFCNEVKKSSTIKVVYIVSNDDRRFQSIARQLPDAVEPVRLYESYLNNFKISSGD
ncbi:MAG: DNA methyltransferase [Kangiellaceae bacterium]|nr:DNA methyltransferase [Kangiellaceae bacterium]